MKVASLWKHDKSEPNSTFTTWLGNLITIIEVDFPISSVFLTNGFPPQRLLKWLETEATGPVTVQHLDDGRSVIAVGSKFDGFMLRSDFANILDLAVISTSSSPEKIRDFVKNAGKRPL